MPIVIPAPMDSAVAPLCDSVAPHGVHKVSADPHRERHIESVVQHFGTASVLLSRGNACCFTSVSAGACSGGPLGDKIRAGACSPTVVQRLHALDLPDRPYDHHRSGRTLNPELFTSLSLVLQRRFKEGCAGTREGRRAAWHGSVWPVRCILGSAPAHRINSSGPNRSRGSISRTTR